MKMKYLFEDYDFLEHFEHMLRNLDWSKVTPEKLEKYNDRLKYFGKRPITSDYNPYDKTKNAIAPINKNRLIFNNKYYKYGAIGLGAAGLGLGAYGIYKWAKKKKQKSQNNQNY